MSRVTSEEVIAIMSDLPAGVTDLSAFISIATNIVDELTDSGMSDDRLKNVELYLSAHFAALKYREAINVILGEAEDDYKNVLKTGYYQTVYGQQAILLDSSGTLKSDSSTTYNTKLSVLVADRPDWNY